MKIPSEIKSNGLVISVERVNGLAVGREDSSLGIYDGNIGCIKLDKMLKGNALGDVFFHEIMEHLNDRYELGLEHDKITQIATLWYGILKENGLLKEG